MLSKKQKYVKDYLLNKNPFIVINEGAIRSGKSFINHFLFLQHMAKYRDERVQFIMTGETIATLQRNVLEDFRNIFGFKIRLDQHNRFELLGNIVNCFGTDNKEAYSKITGFTAHGAYLNEVTLSDFTAVQETIGRCSGDGALILMDCNPDNPHHRIKTEFIDKADGERIISFPWKLEDNSLENGGALNQLYVDNLKATIPPGFWYNRKILGQWTGAEGLCFSEYDRAKHIITPDKLPHQFTRYVAGVDWGYNHHGVILLAGVYDGIYYTMDEIAERGKDINWWVRQKEELDRRYKKIDWFCDTAEPGHIAAFGGLKANKNVTPGIATVNELFRAGRLFIVEGAAPLLEKQMLTYVWSTSGRDEPVKRDDDTVDALRYMLHSDRQNTREPADGIGAYENATKFIL